MPSQTLGPADKQPWAQTRALQRAVLVHLRDTGEMKWTTLYLHFNEYESGQIGPTLGLLARWKHIATDFDGTTKITSAGRERLLYGK